MLVNTSGSEGGLCAETLRVIGLFGALDDGTLGALCGRLQLVNCTAGERVYTQGEPGRALYVILDGEVALTRTHGVNGSQRIVEIARHGPGDWFGERSIIDMMPRSNSAHSVDNSRLVRLCTKDLAALYRYDVKAYALLMMNIARQLSRKLHHIEGRLDPPLDATALPNVSRPV